MRTKHLSVHTLLPVALAIGFVAFTMALPALAQSCSGADCGIAIGGQDRSGTLSAFGDIAKTIQVFLMKYAATVIGSILVFFGIFKIATREAVVGAIAVIGGGALLFLPKIIEQLAKLV